MSTSFEPVNIHVRAEFAGFELDLTSGELTRGPHRVRLQGQPFQLLCVLLEHAGSVVTREELQRRLWSGDTFGDFDNGLNKAIAKLREALDDSKATSKLIETIPRRGYRLTTEVNWIGQPHSNGPVTEEITSQQRRFPSQYLLAGSILLTLLIATAVWFNRRSISSWLGIRPVIQSVAVLPLVNLSNDPEQEYFADGMTEQLITDLSYAKPLRVLSRSSTIGFKGSNLSVPQIAKQLHVDAVIEGTVLRANDTIRVTTRLTAAKPERQLWAASYERNVSDAITLQNQIAADAVNQMRIQLTPAAQTQLSLERRVNPEAYDEYLRGRFFIGQEQPSKAIPYLEHAIQLDHDFAAAYGVLGEAWSLDGLMQAHRWNDGETALRRALELDPNNPYAATYLAILVIEKGRGDEGIRILREVAEKNPVAVYFVRIYAAMLHQTHHIDESLAVVWRAFELDPSHQPTYAVLGRDLVEKGQFREAEDAYRKAGQLTPPFQAWIYAREGNFQAARKILNDNPSMVNPHSAVARYLLGDQEAGLAELDVAANEKSATKTYLMRTDPLFDPMRDDPRFTAIVKKTGLLDN